MKSEELINVCQAVTHGHERYVRNLQRNAEGKVIGCRDDSLEVEVNGRRETWRFEEEITVPTPVETG
jgi:hypothetical protein